MSDLGRGAVTLIVIGGLIWWVSSSPDTPADEKPKPTRAVYRTTASGLYADYEDNEVATKSKIGTSLISIHGKIESITENPMGHPTINFLADHSDSIVGAELNEDQRVLAAAFHPGQSVTLLCDRTARYFNTPVLNGCVVEK